MPADPSVPEPDEPPRDFPDDGDFAVIRSVGAMIRWKEAIWGWDGAGWVIAEASPAVREVVRRKITYGAWEEMDDDV